MYSLGHALHTTSTMVGLVCNEVVQCAHTAYHLSLSASLTHTEAMTHHRKPHKISLNKGATAGKSTWHAPKQAGACIAPGDLFAADSTIDCRPAPVWYKVATSTRCAVRSKCSLNRRWDLSSVALRTLRPVLSLRQTPRATARPGSHVTPITSILYGLWD